MSRAETKGVTYLNGHRIEVVQDDHFAGVGKMVDRDALLALADEIMAKSNDGTRDPDPMRPIASSLDLFGYARRIRKACGVAE